jgi:hypothetical protein
MLCVVVFVHLSKPISNVLLSAYIADASRRV